MSSHIVKLGSLALGVNNRRAPTELDVVLPDRSRGAFLYGADNIDISDKGTATRRRGKTLNIAGSAHSMWSDARDAFAVSNGSLVALTDAGASLSASVIRAGMPAASVSYSRGADGDVYWSNGVAIRRIAAGVDRPIATLPPLTPVLTVTSGQLRAGNYLLAFTTSSVDGESPATAVQQIEVPDGSGIAFSGPSVNIFMSGPDGEVLTYQGTGSGAVLTYDAGHRRCMTLDRAVMPAGTVVRHYNGRMLVAAGNVLYISDPYNYGIFDPLRNFLAFPSPITMVEVTDNSVYIGADQIYWASNLLTDVLQAVSDTPAIRGTGGKSLNGQSVFWSGKRGLVIADKNQSIKYVQDENLAFPQASSGASLFREVNGMTHLVSTHFGNGVNTAGAATFMDAEFIRHETGTTL